MSDIQPVVVEQLYMILASKGVVVDREKFIEIIDTISQYSDMVEAVSKCVDKLGDYALCMIVAGVYVGYKLEECYGSKKCTITITYEEDYKK